MGACICKGDEVNQQIERHMDVQNKSEQMVTKLLLLGSGESGKSTLFKQLQNIYMPSGIDISGADDDSGHPAIVATIRKTMLENMNKVISKAAELYHRDSDKFAHLFIDLDDASTSVAVEIVMSYKDPSQTEFTALPRETLKDIGNAVGVVWDLPSVKSGHKLRGKLYNLDDSADYFFDRAELVWSPDYIPDNKDILMVRIRSIGVVQKRFNINQNVFEIYDAGGQRSERKKWMHHFGDVQAVIFVAALNHYCARLFEDETVNGMHESIKLFATTCNEKHFEKTEMILFLNKNDLFRDRLSEGTSLQVCFHADVGWHGEQWDKDTKEPTAEYEVIDYAPPEPTGGAGADAGADAGSEAEDMALFEQAYTHSVNFVQRQYTGVKENQSKLLYVHVTTATNKENVSKVFWDVQNMIIRKNLLRGGIV